MAKLRKAVHVKDPDRNRMILLLPGEEPEPRLAARITNPDAWEDGQLPDLEDTSTNADEGDEGDTDSEDSPDEEAVKEAAPAAKKTAARKTAAPSRPRGRGAAEKGDSGA